MDRRAFLVALLAGYGCGRNEASKEPAAVIDATPKAAQMRPGSEQALPGGAPPQTTVRRIGWLSPAAPPPPVELEEEVAFLRELGWLEGHNLLVERRYANTRAELFGPLAEELVRLNLELVVTEGTDATLAAKNATKTIPIIIWSAGDPVRMGLVASLTRPGGNITGYSVVGPETSAKSIALLRELLPGLRRVGVLKNSTSYPSRIFWEDLEQACRSIGIEPIPAENAAGSELASAIADVARQRAQALIVQNNRLFSDNQSRVGCPSWTP